MQSVGMMDAYRSFPGTLDIGCGGPQGGQTWASAAVGGMDTVWRNQMASIHAKWGSLAGVQLSMAHELNGNWYPWSATSGQQANLVAAWRRFYGIVQSDLVAKGRNAKVTMNYNAEDIGAPDRTSYWPGDAYVDIVGVDAYDGLGNHEATLPGWVAFAKSHNKPISFPEWGLNPNVAADNPGFITRMNAFFRNNAAMLAGEAYFNEKEATLSTAVPQSRAQYAALSWGV
jgi:beta-mannanase